MQVSILLIIMFLLAGCNAYKNNKNSRPVLKRHQQQQLLARLTYLPEAPLGFDLVDYQQDNRVDIDSFDKIKLVYKNTGQLEFDRNSIVAVYKSDMELLGWQLVSDFQTCNDISIIFKKPSGQHCTLFIDSHGYVTLILS